MSVAVSHLARTPAAPVPRRRALLTVVPVREAALPRAPFAAAVVSLLVAGLIGLLVLNTVLGKDAFHLHELQVEGRALADTEQALTREVESLRAPSALAEKAAALGMVQAGPPAFLRLPDGAVLGSAVPAEAPLPPEGEAAAVAEEEPVEQPVAEESSSDSDSDSETSDDESSTDE